MKSFKINYSVIIPHYQDIDGLKQLIHSIPHRDDLQIIVIDDNSFPETEIVKNEIEQIGRDDIKLGFNDLDKRGAGGCRNKGIAEADGKWLIFADADDMFTEGAFQAFDEYEKSEADLICFSMTSINIPSKKQGTRHLQYAQLIQRYVNNPNQRNELNVRFSLPSPCSKMIKHSMIDEYSISFDDTRWANDDMFSAKCGYYASAIKASDKVVYCITRKNGTLTTNKSDESFKVKLDTYIRKVIFLKENLSRKDFRRSIRWPGNKLITAKLEGYSKEIIRFAMDEYKKNGISLRWINRSDIDEVFIKLKSWFRDREYSKRI